MRVVVLSDRNIKLFREFTGAELSTSRRVIELHRQQKAHPVYKERILACKDLESLKLELVKMFDEINPEVSIRFPMDKLLSILNENIDSFETEDVHEL